MRFSTSAIFVFAVAALSVDAAVIPRSARAPEYVKRDAIAAAAPVVAPVARDVPVVAAPPAKRMHARDFHAARRAVAVAKDPESIVKREPDVPVIQVYKRVHARDFPKREQSETVKVVKRESPQPYKRMHARDFTSFRARQTQD